ncbi:hypothetical protein PR202_ga08217 [Eleusine coracana subsp. coracana]|uniref:Uncharacterized protein n=1 Tax=Eleusine coracana subsp. coracana TaxID=191504 RepID=A0AAV5C1N0_ELECO|nr:hypothetical protein PR202_ga08217 [Eleusine coracana subsp. coracana]
MRAESSLSPPPEPHHRRGWIYDAGGRDPRIGCSVAAQHTKHIRICGNSGVILVAHHHLSPQFPMPVLPGRLQGLAMHIDKMAEETFNEHHKSVVYVMGRSAASTGIAKSTGFVIGRKGTSCLVMLCAHQVRNDDAITIRLPGQTEEYRATKMDKYCANGSDIAIIKADGVNEEVKALEFCDMVDVAAKTVVIRIGFVIPPNMPFHPLNPSVSIGTVTTKLVQNRSMGIADLVYSANGRHGLSGSVLLLGNKVIGMTYAIGGALEKDLGYARPSGTIHFQLKIWLNKQPNVSLLTLC